MSSTQEKPLDLSGLADRYEIVGEYAALGRNRRYPARRKEDGRDVLITVLRAAADVAQGKAIAQFAADANLMTTLNHPNVAAVVEGRWVGEDAFALITDRIQGATVAEQLKGERLTNPRIAEILGDVDGVLEWARGERLSHRAVTPDSIWVERGTNRVFVTLSPTDAPKTNRPDARDDARTIGALALTLLTAKPMADPSTSSGQAQQGTLINMRPDLPQRVVDATEKLAVCTINDETPNISAYLAALAMADAIKEGEVEVARVEAEFRAQMHAEREKWEAEQHECQLANDAQAKKFAEERTEYERRSAKEREQLAAARTEVDKRRDEVQEARAELDQARAAYKQKKAELEARSKQLDRHMSDLEKQKRALQRRAAELEIRNQELRDLTALAASAMPVAEHERTTMPLPAFVDPQEEMDAKPLQDDVEVMQEAVAAEEEVKAWTPIETKDPWAVPLETDEPARAIQYEAAAIPEPPKRHSRAAWAVPAGIAALALLAVGLVWGTSRDTTTSTVASLPPASVTTTQPAERTDSAAGTLVPVSDSAVFTAIRDSIIAADEARRLRRERAAAAAEAERQRAAAATYTDSAGTVWSVIPPDSFAKIRRADSVAKARRDSIARVRPDTTVKRGQIP